MTTGTWQSAAWMQTYTGRAFRPFEATADDIDPVDIAHSLSLTCRYNGHVSRFYSVAEHCVLMAEHFSAAGDRKNALWALLHDAAEAYIGDMVRPLKVTDMMAPYRVIDRDLTALIVTKWGLDGSAGMPPEVKDADNRILLDERYALLGDPAEPWHQDSDGTQPLGVPIVGWQPAVAEQRYLSMLEALMPEQPPIGGTCEDCGHYAGRHGGFHVNGGAGCAFPRADPDNPCDCTGMVWQGVVWPRPWLPAPEGLTA